MPKRTIPAIGLAVLFAQPLAAVPFAVGAWPAADRTHAVQLHRIQGREGRAGDRRRYGRPHDYPRGNACHRQPIAHGGGYGFHRHVGTACRPVRMRPQYRSPLPQEYCLTVGVVRFCDVLEF